MACSVSPPPPIISLPCLFFVGSFFFVRGIRQGHRRKIRSALLSFTGFPRWESAAALLLPYRFPVLKYGSPVP